MAKPKLPIPVTLLTGYLGSGKTTLINHVLGNQEGYKCAVIVNDIGEVNIDAELIQKAGVVTQKMTTLFRFQTAVFAVHLRLTLSIRLQNLLSQANLIIFSLRQAVSASRSLLHSLLLYLRVTKRKAHLLSAVLTTL